MAKVMPVAIRDETGAFIRQMSQGNEALAQLYTKLLAQYEERRANEEFRREMADRQEATGDRRSADADQRWYDRTTYAHNLRNPQPPQERNYLGPGGGGVPNSNPMAPGTPAAAPTAAPAPTSSGPPQRPSVYTYDKNPFGKGAGASAPVTPAPQASNTGALVEEFSAQSRALPTTSQPPKTPKREPTPNTQLPTQPRPPTARTAATRPQGNFLDVDQRWLDLMHQKEDEFNLPRGTMMTTYGLENGGGRQFGRNPNSKSANPPEGIFQFSKDLRDTYKLSDQDIYDPAKMIHWAAYNMRRNADILEANHKVKLPLTPEAIPLFYALHQWGERGGPRAVAAYLQNPDQPMASDNVMGTHKDAKGNVLSNFTILEANGHKGNVTVREALQNKAAPWYSTYVRQYTDHAHQPQGKYTPTPGPPPQQQPQQQGGDPNAPRPPGAIPPQQHGTMGSDPRLVAAVRGGAELALPEGYTIRQTSGARPGGRSSSHHHRGNAGDFQIFTPDGRPIPNRGEDTTGLYTKLARGVKSWIRENDPEAERRIGWGGAFETSKGSGVPDLMHFDWGRSRGRLRPDVQFAKLQPLAAEERRTAATQQPQQPVKVAGPVPARETPAPAVAPERAIMPAISRIPTSPEVAATFDKQIDNAGFDKRTPDAAAAILEGGPPIKAGAGQLAARSELDYGMPSDLQAANVPMPIERPTDIPQDITPQASGLAARSDLDYNEPPPPAQRADPSVAPYEPAPEYEDSDAVPKAATPFDWPEEGMPTSPDIAGPPISLAGQLPAAPPPQENYPPPDFPQVAETSHNYDPNSRAGRRIDAARRQQQAAGPTEPSYFDQLVRQATEGANIVPNAPPQTAGIPPPPSGQVDTAIAMPGTQVDTPPETQKPLSPIMLRSIQEAIYGDARPKGQSRAQQELDYVRRVNPPTPPTDGPTSDERQAQFNAAMQEYVREKLGGAPVDVARGTMESIFKGAPDVMQRIIEKAKEYSKPSPPPKLHPTAQHPQTPAPAPIRTMPDGRPYIPPAEPLKVPPPASRAAPPTQMPNVTKAPMPATPGVGAPAAQQFDLNTAAGRQAAAAAKVGSGDNYSYTDDSGAVQYEIKE